MTSALELPTVEQVDPDYSQQCWDIWRAQNGYAIGSSLLRMGENHKTTLDDSVAILTLSLAPDELSGYDVCPWSTPECRPPNCIATNGNGRWDRTMQARILRTRWLFANPAAFCSLAAAEIDAAYRIHGKRLRVRLNTFSDVPWERVAPWLFTGPRRHVRFYDYTKGWRRADKTPRNYRLTLSAGSRTPEAAISAQVARGHAVAVVFPQSRGKALPASLGPNRVIDGDRSDNRYHDRGVVVGLRAKGTMRTASRTLARP